MNCPVHNREMERQESPVGTLLVCPDPTCERAVKAPTARPLSPQLALPVVAGGRTQKVARVLERDIERQIDDGLKANGYIVCSTSEKRRGVTCPHCGGYFVPTHGLSGITIGLPDRFFSAEWMPPFLWAAIEVKGSHTAVRPAQQELADRGRVAIARSWADAEKVVQQIERLFKNREEG